MYYNIYVYEGMPYGSVEYCQNEETWQKHNYDRRARYTGRLLWQEKREKERKHVLSSNKPSRPIKTGYYKQWGNILKSYKHCRFNEIFMLENVTGLIILIYTSHLWLQMGQGHLINVVNLITRMEELDPLNPNTIK